MSSDSYSQITANGLWHNNPVLAQGLGLCPLLAVTASVVNALGLGLATIAVLCGSNIVVSSIRNHVSDSIRLPVFVLVIAAFTTCTELLMKAYTYDLYQILGIFIPLIVTNCVILGRAETFASRHSLLPAAWDGLMMGLGFTLVLIVLGAMRELLGSGTLLANMHLLLGEGARHWVIQLPPTYRGFLLAILPPGAFLATGLLMAGKNLLERGLTRTEPAQTQLIASDRDD